MGWGGIFREFVPGERFVATERFDQPWYPGEALITQSLAEHGGKTTLTATLRYESCEARDRVLNTHIEHGLAQSYERLDEFLANSVGKSTRARA